MASNASGQMTAEDAAGQAELAPIPVRRAVAFIENNAADRITLADIAAAAGLGIRALQHNFRRHYDTTPLRYLQSVRLEHVHRDLQAADPTTGDTVTAIAARWQFTHPSHFTAAYRRTYGQTPGHTLRNRTGADLPTSLTEPRAGQPPAGYGSTVGTSRRHRANTRRHRADKRDRIADERDRALDERERIADERDRIADEREKKADERERRLTAREDQLNRQLIKLGAPADQLIDDSRAAIERGREAAERTLAKLDRSAALLDAEDRTAEREQAKIEDEVAASWRSLDE